MMKLEEIEEMLEAATPGWHYAAAPTIIKELVERVRKLESVIYDKYVEHQDYGECDCSICKTAKEST